MVIEIAVALALLAAAVVASVRLGMLIGKGIDHAIEARAPIEASVTKESRGE